MNTQTTYAKDEARSEIDIMDQNKFVGAPCPHCHEINYFDRSFWLTTAKPQQPQPIDKDGKLTGKKVPVLPESLNCVHCRQRSTVRDFHRSLEQKVFGASGWSTPWMQTAK